MRLQFTLMEILSFDIIWQSLHMKHSAKRKTVQTFLFSVNYNVDVVELPLKSLNCCLSVLLSGCETFIRFTRAERMQRQQEVTLYIVLLDTSPLYFLCWVSEPANVLFFLILCMVLLWLGILIYLDIMLGLWEPDDTRHNC